MTERLYIPVAPDEYVDKCHYSRTGYAIWKRDPSNKECHDGQEFRNWCTCRAARNPEPAITDDSAAEVKRLRNLLTKVAEHPNVHSVIASVIRNELRPKVKS